MNWINKITYWYVSLIFVSACSVFEPDDANPEVDKIYITFQGLDKVGIIEYPTGKVDTTITIDFDTDDNLHTPHFTVIDEENNYWFVTTIRSGWVGRYNLKSNAFIDKVFVDDSPALMAASTANKKLYVSRMMPMGMMQGAVSTIIQEIDYSDPAEMTLNEYILNSPAPHGIAINNRGNEVYVASNTADWLWKINTEDGTTSSSIMDPEIGNTSDTETQRLKPIQVVSVDDSLILVTCSGGIWINSYTKVADSLSGQVQLWNSASMTKLDAYTFDWKSTPWHIAASPVEKEVYIALSGDQLYAGSAGVACLSYKDNALSFEWETKQESFSLLHGIAVSRDGERLFVSGRGDNQLHVLEASTGKFLQSISLEANAMATGISVYRP